MARLNHGRSLLAVDEPELHLHPRLLARVMGFFQSIAERCPVVLATHSRRLLDELRDPASSAVLCELDEHNATRLRYPDRAALEDWLKDYEGLGRLLDAGYESEVMVPRTEA
jgi:predicted ATPase